MYKKVVKSYDFSGQKMSFEVGEFAPRADAAVIASMGETVVLVTVAISKEDTDMDYFPLHVEFIEKFYAGGVISGSRFVKRERFPSENAILQARMIDRTLRPLFPKGLRREVQVVITLLSYDKVNEPVVLAINAASAALCLSGIDFEGPVAGLRVGLKDGELILNPTKEQLDESGLDMILSGKGKDIVMIDADAKEVSEEKISSAFDLAVEHFSGLIAFQEEFVKEVNPQKIEIVEAKKTDSKLQEAITKKYGDQIKQAAYDLEGKFPGESRSKILREIISEYTVEVEDAYSKTDISAVVDDLVKKTVRNGILKDNKRPSGRGMDEVRKINCRIGILPRTHGSAFFARGITQALSIVTLGSTRLEQKLESFQGEDTKQFMHHYNGQSFSVGEAGRYNYYPGRREIGHGALAEKALKHVIPLNEKFPYTIRVVSEVLCQQGSSSMASVCGATLALMDAGVPIKSPVSGIAIGLVTGDDSKDYVLLTDMQDMEDFYGDMDFKVAGTSEGITAIQMDNKLKGIRVDILKAALNHAKKARLTVLEKMLAVLPSSHKELSKYAPKITTIKINTEKIGELIGPGGKVIKGIIEETGAEVDIKDDGTVHIMAESSEARDRAIKMVESIVEEPEIGSIYEGVVSRVAEYGVFVDISPAISGLVHVSEMADEYVKDPSQLLKEGEKVRVKIIGIDNEGKVSLSIKRVKGDEK